MLNLKTYGGNIMETHPIKNDEMNLVELFWNILFSWRQIICFGIIFALLLSGIKYFSDIRKYRQSENLNIEEDIELSEVEMQQVNNVKILMERIEEYKNYLSSSPLMQMNLYEKPVTELQYYVDSDYTFDFTKKNKNDYTNDLITMYCNYIQSGELSNTVIEEAKLSVNQANLNELWSISTNQNSILIRITYPEEEKINSITKSITKQLQKKETEFQEIGAHKLKLLMESEKVIVDNTMIDRKSQISGNIATFAAQLNNLKASMNEQQLAYLDKEQKSEDNADELQILIPRLSVKYVIIGAFFGIIIICIWIACKMIFSSKLQNSEEIRTIYNARLFGEVRIPPKKRAFLSMIDDKLLSLKNRKRKQLTSGQQISIAVANIALSCKQQGIESIYITGSEYEKADIETLNILKQELSNQNVKVKDGESIYYNAESLKEGTKIGNLLFIEQKGQSIYDEIANELTTAKEQNSNVLGFIVFV